MSAFNFAGLVVFNRKRRTIRPLIPGLSGHDPAYHASASAVGWRHASESVRGAIAGQVVRLTQKAAPKRTPRACWLYAGVARSLARAPESMPEALEEAFGRRSGGRSWVRSGVVLGPLEGLQLILVESCAVLVPGRSGLRRRVGRQPEALSLALDGSGYPSHVRDLPIRMPSLRLASDMHDPLSSGQTIRASAFPTVRRAWRRTPCASRRARSSAGRPSSGRQRGADQ